MQCRFSCLEEWFEGIELWLLQYDASEIWIAIRPVSDLDRNAFNESDVLC